MPTLSGTDLAYLQLRSIRPASQTSNTTNFNFSASSDTQSHPLNLSSHTNSLAIARDFHIETSPGNADSLRELAINLRKAELAKEEKLDTDIHGLWSNIANWKICWIGHYHSEDPSDHSYATRGSKLPLMIRVFNDKNSVQIECITSIPFTPQSGKNIWSVKIEFQEGEIMFFRNEELYQPNIVEKEFLEFLAKEMDLPKY